MSEMKRRERLAIAAAGLAMLLVLVSVAVITSWSLIRGHGELQEVQRSIAVSDAYREAVNAAVLTDLYAQRLFAQKDITARPGFEASMQSAFDAAERINQVGNDEDRRLLSELEAELSPQLGQAFVLLNSLDQNQLADIDQTRA